ncbi:hypothetical protein IAQ67_13920 [Paenibacillus peoriae]|uniref:Uncharacterized protein n=1 Tax=Paenibacillus peoriae TaxID=59893 RepID=A0A7H0Y1R9_9BACL|nr:hypothetical protein [Paenibacillus peoriae]QNR65027.1 hypothetical protein IAQ67_13920 [Paenibacillus peoriae]
MKISFLENGLDSLKKGIGKLTIYEEELYLKKNKTDHRFFYLKDAILNLHHGIEVLFKYILNKESPYLVFSNINEHVHNGFMQMRQKGCSSIFETESSHKIHTVTYNEAIKRVTKVLGLEISKELGDKLEDLERLRNQITHSEIFFSEQSIHFLFNGLLDELDVFFLKAIGEEYKTLSGYSELRKNYSEYLEFLKKNNLEQLGRVIQNLSDSFDKHGISMGMNDVKVLTDINKAEAIIKALLDSGAILGADFYNGHCSGHLPIIERIDKEHFRIYASDNDANYIFKFKSLLVYLPEIEMKQGPVLYFEASEEEAEEKYSDYIKYRDMTNINVKYVEYMEFEDGKVIISPKDIYRFYEEKENNEYYVMPKYTDVFRFYTKGIFCFINVQPLDIQPFDIDKIVNLDAKTLEVALRRNLNNEYQNFH